MSIVILLPTNKDWWISPVGETGFILQHIKCPHCASAMHRYYSFQILSISTGFWSDPLTHESDNQKFTQKQQEISDLVQNGHPLEKNIYKS